MSSFLAQWEGGSKSVLRKVSQGVTSSLSKLLPRPSPAAAPRSAPAATPAAPAQPTELSQVGAACQQRFTYLAPCHTSQQGHRCNVLTAALGRMMSLALGACMLRGERHEIWAGVPSLFAKAMASELCWQCAGAAPGAKTGEWVASRAAVTG